MVLVLASVARWRKQSRHLSWLSSGCRDNMLDFFATSGDFTRRLTSVKANPKFSSPLSGPEDFYSVSSCDLRPMHTDYHSCCLDAVPYVQWVCDQHLTA